MYPLINGDEHFTVIESFSFVISWKKTINFRIPTKMLESVKYNKIDLYNMLDILWLNSIDIIELDV